MVKFTRVNINILFELLKEVNGATFLSIDTETQPEMYRTIPGERDFPNPHYGRITKWRHGVSVMAFQNKLANGYESMVRRRLVEEGKDPDFKVSPRRWGTRMENLPVVEYNGMYYLEVIFLRETGETKFLLDGRPIDQFEIIGLKPHPPADQGGLANKVMIRTYAFDTIRRLRINNQTYAIDVK